MTILVFDIETIPDTESGQKLYHLHDLEPAALAEAMYAKQREKSGHDFLPHYLHKIVAISLVIAQKNSVKVWSLGDEQASEAELVTRFFAGIDKYTPTLVSWNGGGFDLPVLHYRALLHGISAKTYWETGETQSAFRWNNYLSRYHMRHMDLMDILAIYQNRAFAPLDDIATLLGFPGKMGMHGSRVWEAYRAGDIASIRNYCETDVLNTYCVYLRFERMRGHLSTETYTTQMDILKQYLATETERPHLQAFLEALTP